MAYLERYCSKLSSDAERRKQTVSLWFKLTRSTDFGQFMAAGQEINNDGIYTKIGIDSQGRLEIRWWDDSQNLGARYSTIKIRDTSNWYHVMYVFDTTLSNSADRLKIYLNGVRVTAFDTASDPTQNKPTWFGFNKKKHRILAYNLSASPSEAADEFNGNAFDFYFVDGQALGPDVFGVERHNGWKPKNPTGIINSINSTGGFGTNGFYLPLKEENTLEDVDSLITLDTDSYFQASFDNRPTFDQAYGPNSAIVGSLTTHSTGGPFPGTGYASGFTQPSSTDSTNDAVGLRTGFTSAWQDWFSDGGHTFMGWIKTTESGNRDGLWHVKVPMFGDFRGSVYIGMGVNNGHAAIGAQFVAEGTSNVADGNWHHIAVTLSSGGHGGTTKIYVDGNLEYNNNTSAWTNNNSAHSINGRLDCIGFTYAYSGVVPPQALAGVQHIGRELSQTEIQYAVDGKRWSVGADQSGKENHFTAKESLFVTSDNPTNSFCIIDQAHKTLTPGPTLSDDNIITHGGLRSALPSGADNNTSFGGSISVSKGKWYYEVMTIVDQPSDGAGWINESAFGANLSAGIGHSVCYRSNGGVFAGNSVSRVDIPSETYDDTGTTGDILGCYIDLDNKSIGFTVNGVDQGVVRSGAQLPEEGVWSPVLFHRNNGGTLHFNFGQDSTFGDETSEGAFTDDNGLGSFKYQPPSGYLSLCERNVDSVNNITPSDYFDILLYTGTNSNQSITGLNFKPDFVWTKPRDFASNHALMDVVRGPSNQLCTNSNDLEATNSSGKGLQSFDSNGFTLGTESDALGSTNISGVSYVAWCWKAGGAPNDWDALSTGVYDEDGTSNASATVGYFKGTTLSGRPCYGSFNKVSGFSIIRYQGNGSAGHKIPHHLGVTPGHVMIKKLTDVGTSDSGRRNWINSWPKLTDQTMLISETVGVSGHDGYYRYGDQDYFWGDGDTGFQQGNYRTNQVDDWYIAYCWADTPGMYATGRYWARNDGLYPNGTTVRTGFKPKLVIIKNTDSGSGYSSWGMIDLSRIDPNGGNGATYDDFLWSNANYTEGKRGVGSNSGSFLNVDLLSNGFRITGGGTNYETNEISGRTYYWMAFADDSDQSV